MPPKQRRARHPSALTDNAQPGSATSMDVMLRWLTTPGNVKRWRTETRGRLCQEIVDEMEAVGITHRDLQYVRYKVGAIEKHYIKAKQWLLETGMHDAFLSSKAAKEVKAHVDHLCPDFRTLDPVFRGVPFAKKKVEVVELDEESAESVEEKDTASASVESEEEEKQETAQQTQPKKKKFRDVLSTAAKVAMQALADPPKKRGRPPKAATAGTPTRRPSSTTSRTPTSAGEETEKSTARARRTEKEAEAEEEKGEHSHAAVATEVDTELFEQGRAAAAAGSEKPAVASNVDTQKTQENVTTDDVEEHKSGDEQFAQEEKSKRTASSPKPTAKLSLAERRKAHDKEAPPVKRKTKGGKQPANNDGKRKAPVQKAISAKGAMRQEKQASKQSNMGKRKSSGEEPRSLDATANATQFSVAKQSELDKRESSGDQPSSVDATTTGEQGTAKESNAAKRKAHEEELASIKRARIEEEMDTERKFAREVERKALLKRVKDEEQQRQEVYAFERAKMKCELEAKQIQVLYEKATARKKLDQLGLSQEEIDRIIPL